MIKHIQWCFVEGCLCRGEDEANQQVSGLDHPFALPVGHVIMLVSFMAKIQVASCSSRQRLPCFVVYTASFVDESVIIGGQPMVQHNGIALEAQALPDAIHSDLKAIWSFLKAGEAFTMVCVMSLLWNKKLGKKSLKLGKCILSGAENFDNMPFCLWKDSLYIILKIALLHSISELSNWTFLMGMI